MPFTYNHKTGSSILLYFFTIKKHIIMPASITEDSKHIYGSQEMYFCNKNFLINGWLGAKIDDQINNNNYAFPFTMENKQTVQYYIYHLFYFVCTIWNSVG